MRWEDTWYEIFPAFSVSKHNREERHRKASTNPTSQQEEWQGAQGLDPSSAQAIKPRQRHIFPLCPELSPSGKKAFGCLPDSTFKIQIPGQNTSKFRIQVLLIIQKGGAQGQNQILAQL